MSLENAHKGSSHPQPVLASNGQTDAQPSAQIDPNRVEAILVEALTDPPAGDVIRGILHSYSLDVAKVASHRGEIVAMLEQWPEEFFDNGGGGWTFLNLCETRDGVLWTGLHLRCEQLCVLADVLGLLSYPLPRDMWSMMPGGLPYVAFKRSLFAQVEAA
jgi:hypothetical protein